MQGLLRIVGIIIVLLILILLVAVGVIYAQSESIINQTFEVTAPELALPELSDEVMAEGRRIFVTRGCGDCHTANGGGSVMVDDGALGKIIAPNITSGAGGINYSQEDYLNAIMHGVSAEGRGLVIMPSQVYTQWREEEIAPLIVFLLNMPPVDNELGESSYGIVGRALVAANLLPMGAANIDHDTVGFIELEADVSVDYGRYLFNVCLDCHTASAAGGEVPGAGFIAANLTASESGIGSWSEEDFVNALRTGQRPDGSLIDAVKMPWASFSAMTDTEIGALYAYLRSLPPVENEN